MHVLSCLISSDCEVWSSFVSRKGKSCRHDMLFATLRSVFFRFFLLSEAGGLTLARRIGLTS